MKRLHYLAVLMVLGSSVSTAQAGYSHSFVIGGHRIHLEARRGCRWLSCVSWYDSGSRDRRDRDDDAPAKPTVVAPAPAQPAPAVQARSTCAPVQQPVQQAQVQPASAPQAQAPQVQIAPPPPPAPVVTAPPATKISTETVAPRTVELAATTTQSVPPPAPKVEARIVVLPSPVVTQSAAPAPAKAKDEKAKDEKAKDEKATNEETAADTPLGDWQTEGKKGLVRIEQCGKSLCGYVLNRQTSAKGETVLSNMKSQTDNKWAGDIYSRASGNSYYARMTLKTPNTLHVEACAVLRFFCSGKDWTRVVTRPDEMIISRKGTNPPSS